MHNRLNLKGMWNMLKSFLLYGETSISEVNNTKRQRDKLSSSLVAFVKNENESRLEMMRSLEHLCAALADVNPEKCCKTFLDHFSFSLHISVSVWDPVVLIVGGNLYWLVVN